MGYEQQKKSGGLVTLSQITDANYAVDAEGNDTYVITLDPAPTAYQDGMTIKFRANTANTGAATLNANSLGAKTIKKENDKDLQDNDIEAGSIVTVVFDETDDVMKMVSTDANLNLDEIGQSSSAKTTPVDADSVEIVDSEASNVHKRTTWTNVKAFLKTYFDTLYQDILAEGAFVDGDKTKLDGVATNATANPNAIDNLSEDTSPQLGGDLDTNGNDINFAEEDTIDLDNSMSADEKWSGIAIDGTAGATIAVGDLVYLDVTAGEWLLADASAVGTAGTVPVGLCILASTDGNATKILLHGTMRSAAFPASIALGAPVYVSETAGDITATAPTTADAVVRVLGFAITVEPNTIYFNPSPDHITVTG